MMMQTQYRRTPAQVRGAAVLAALTAALVASFVLTPAGSLANSLDTNISPAGSSAPTEGLNSLSQDVAIMTARATVINEISILKIGAYGNALRRPKH